VDFIVLNRDELPRDGNTYEFEGFQHNDTDISLILVDMPSGHGVRLHKHPYKEIFIISEGSATFTVGKTTLEARAGQIIIVSADTPHKFVNSGDMPLKQIDIHLNKQYITEWLAE
jgi:mannose-6-phosphate isomerase-like protein (cupin superfamily)